MKKDFLLVVCIALLIAIFFSGTKIQSVEQYESVTKDTITEETPIVYLSIDARSIKKNEKLLKPELLKYMPSDGVILKKTAYVLRKNDTAFDLLLRATRQNKIQMEYQGATDNSFNSVYVQGINYLYEFSAGSNSGWMYRVNESFPNKGISRYKLKEGDVVALQYTTNLGNDIGGRQ
ncbi:DUF4430 domain-containing protein [Kurthia sibirica]|uniref:Transcobalamin-like C-terminal domain-containing protein n=1 Tax=Kurthia sibirica TaxID=202750 RepID=A0A2U3ALF6_9BACL|nr:DUF4430 domain-containing protein [Kurthia sibirica]PWI25342.1 hypothetical protein DEX24_08350 [Kurthia sibirica]GEK34412.1 hypothetical protein KSI01_19450 [Kurthia sibirica]